MAAELREMLWCREAELKLCKLLWVRSKKPLSKSLSELTGRSRLLNACRAPYVIKQLKALLSPSG
jgi:hypothetical protein